MIAALILVAAWLVAIEPEPCSAPSMADTWQCKAAATDRERQRRGW